MAEGLLRARLADRELEDKVHVHSAGLLEGGMPATTHAQAVVLGIDGHVSRQLTRELIEGADVVVGMTREHVRETSVLVPDALRRTFTLKELVRRGQAAGPRRQDEDLDRWLARVGAGRSTNDLMGSSRDDDVSDPIGKPRKDYERTAAKLDDLLAKLVDLIWPARSS
jgi:protein-tyrosine phosphatase